MNVFLNDKVYHELTPKQRKEYGDMIRSPTKPPSQGPGVAPRGNPWRTLASEGEPTLVGDPEDYQADIGPLRPEEVATKPGPEAYAGKPVLAGLPGSAPLPNGWQALSNSGNMESYQPSVFDLVKAAYQRGPMWTK